MAQKWEKLPLEDLKNIFENSSSYKEIAEKLNYSYCGKSLKMIKEIAQKYNFQLNLKTKTKQQKEQDKQSIIGKTFGRLTVLDFDIDKTNQTKRTYYICQCSCPNKTITSVRLDGLLDKNNPILSCGCLQREAASRQGKLNRTDYTGQRFGKITVIKIDEEKTKEKKVPYWLCKCDCGTEISVLASSLRRGIKSCGCLQSKNEFIIKQILERLHLSFETQKAFPGLSGNSELKPLRFDFYLPEYNVCIEYQGEQHYYSVALFGGEEKFIIQQKYDELKRLYCKENNIKLIEIPYWDQQLINEQYILQLLQTDSFKEGE